MRIYLNLALAAGIIILALSVIIKPQTGNPTSLEEQTNQEEVAMPIPEMQFTQAEQVIEEGKSYQAILTTTEGKITIALDSNTPITSNNFVFLAQKGYYDNTIFHRAIEGFMIQGGDPTGTGSGSPGYKFADEEFEGKYTRGVVAMANAGPNTNGSQFFIMHQDYDLPPNYIIFGHVTEGIEVVDAIATAQVQPNATGEPSQPVEPVSIVSVDIDEI